MKAQQPSRSVVLARIALLAFVAFAPVTGKTEFRQITGDLAGFLNSIATAIPGPNSEAFVEPSAADRAQFSSALVHLLRRNYSAAATLADAQGYALIEFTDVFSDLQPYYILMEKTGSGFRGLGSYAFNPAARRRLSIQAPHVPSDTDTGPESVQAFLELDAEFWQINGTHRCANEAHSVCDGSTETCDDHGIFHVSDVAHFTRNFFQVANDTVAATLQGIVSIQLHSFAVCSGNDPETTPLAQISLVSLARYADSMATRLARRINERTVATGYLGRGAASWNAPDAEADVQATSENTCPRFNGGSNVQGRSLHGSPDPCETPVNSIPVVERFVHLEQRSLLTRPGPGFPDHPGISRDIVIAAIAAEFPAPSQRWVNFTHFGLELGTFAFPHNTLMEAVGAAGAGEILRLRAGASAETGTFARPVLLRGFDGPVTIGK